MTPESDTTVNEGEELKPSPLPIPQEYAENGLTVVYDELHDKWIVVNSDGSMLRPIARDAKYYYPQEKP